MNIIQQLEQDHIKVALARRGVPEFAPGDTLKVMVRVIEAAEVDPRDKKRGKPAKEPTERLQAYEGVCIARSGSGLNESFTVRKISYGEGVERVFPIHSPFIAEIEVLRRGRVRRAKLYYLRGRRGKSARIFERTDARARRLNAAFKGFKKPKGAPDDLTKLAGVDAELAQRFAQLGIIKYEQIASFSDDDIANVEEALSLDDAFARNDWAGSAQRQMAEATAGEAVAAAEEEKKS